ncbi:MAG: type II toxin-antitoxin system VapC family toxin [Phycisphaerae bacterium]
MTYVLDTDHVTLLHRGGVSSDRIRLKMRQAGSGNVVTTIVSYEESVRGWMAAMAAARTITDIVRCYQRLRLNFDLYQQSTLLDFDEPAAIQFQQLRARKLRIGTMDLRIAAIAIANSAVLVTRNAADFGKIAGLTIECWA